MPVRWQVGGFELVDAFTAGEAQRRSSLPPARALAALAPALRPGAELGLGGARAARSILSRFEPGAAAGWLSQPQLVDRVAELVSSRRLLVVAARAPAAGRVLGVALAQAADARTADRAPPPRAGAPIAPDAAIDLFPTADLDVAAEVQVLALAARDGVPFCEVCVRAPAA